jgi:hypothetical protein
MERRENFFPSRNSNPAGNLVVTGRKDKEMCGARGE